jgi:calcineurin-like phosphoesterase family protein
MRSETWFTADLHIGHKFIAGERGFPDPSAHDDVLATHWDVTVASADTVWVLGDISGGGRGSQQRALDWLAARPGVKHLIAGNHDGVHPMNPDAHKMMPAYLDVFASVQQAARRRLAGRDLLMSHFPYLESRSGDDTHSRFDQWRLPDLGSWLVHGHLHTSRQLGAHSVHVGLDAWGLAPVSIDQVAVLISTAEAGGQASSPHGT